MIDDTTAGGQTDTTEDANTFHFCSALHPAQHLAVLWRAAQEHPGCIAAPETMHTGGEDWPDAYCATPMQPADAEACVVTYWHDDWQEPAFQVYAGLLFGLPLAVTSFNRYSKLCEALVRRLLLIDEVLDDDAEWPVRVSPALIRNTWEESPFHSDAYVNSGLGHFPLSAVVLRAPPRVGTGRYDMTPLMLALIPI